MATEVSEKKEVEINDQSKPQSDKTFISLIFPIINIVLSLLYFVWLLWIFVNDGDFFGLDRELLRQLLYHLMTSLLVIQFLSFIANTVIYIIFNDRLHKFIFALFCRMQRWIYIIFVFSGAFILNWIGHFGVVKLILLIPWIISLFVLKLFIHIMFHLLVKGNLKGWSFIPRSCIEIYTGDLLMYLSDRLKKRAKSKTNDDKDSQN